MADSVLVGLSGGVDSAAAAALLVQRGFDVVGAFCAMHELSDTALDDARAVAAALDIPLLVLDERERFRACVVDDFARAYSGGKTPNPCVICNPLVKFAALARAADERGVSRIATGHYAATGCENGRAYIKKSPAGDQSYMLSRLPQEIISRLELPLCGQDKPALRLFAEKSGLPVAQKRASQDICFAGGDYAAFLGENGLCPAALTPGDFVLAVTGEVVGRHNGIARYTVGQRKGLGVALGAPAYVCAIDPHANAVLLSMTPPAPLSAPLTGLCWQKRVCAPGESFACAVKVRFGARDCPAVVTVGEAGAGSVAFDSPAACVAPGQTAVFYDGDDIVGAAFFAGTE